MSAKVVRVLVPAEGPDEGAAAESLRVLDEILRKDERIRDVVLLAYSCLSGKAA